jgi:thioredoxin-related protein
VIRTFAMLALMALPAAADELTMVMVEQEGCIYCARWDAEAAPAWPVTEVGRAAPLRRVDLRDLPDDLDFASPPVLTPTFVLMRDGAELSRLEGYDPQFFWPMVERMVADADPDG